MFVWSALYLLLHVVCSLSLGCFVSGLKKVFPYHSIIKFLAGAAGAPFFIALSVYFLGIVWPGAPVWIRIPFPMAVCIALALVCRNYRHLIDFFVSVSLVFVRSIKKFSFVLCAGVLLIMAVSLTTKLYVNTKTPVIHNDALHYLIQARMFAQDGDSLAFDSDDPQSPYGNAYIPDSHGALWPCYLGHAILFSPGQQAHYPGDVSARLAIQLTTPYFLFAFAALCLLVRRDIKTLVFSLALLFAVWRFGWLAYGFSRDFFRLAALLLLTAYALSVYNRARDGVPFVTMADWFVSAALVYYTIQGHAVNVVMAGIILIALTVFLCFKRIDLSKIILWASGALTGGGGGFVKNIWHLFKHGELRISSSIIRQGTPLEIKPGKAETAGFADVAPIYGYGWNEICIILGLAGLVFLIFRLVTAIKNKRLIDDENYIHYGFTVLTLALLLPIFGAFDLGYALSEWFLMNFRYSLYIFPYLAILGSLFLILVLVRAKRAWMTVAVTAICGTLAFYSISVKWPVLAPSGEMPFIYSYIKAGRWLAQNIPGERVFSNNERANYYFDSLGTVILSPASRALILDQTEPELEETLRFMDISAVALFEDGYDLSETSLCRYLNAKVPNIKLEGVRLYPLAIESEG